MKSDARTRWSTPARGRRRLRSTGRTGLLAVLAVILGAIGAQAAASSNAITNGDFSQGLSGWTKGVVAKGSFSGYPNIAVSTISRCDPSQAASNPFLIMDVPGGAKGYLDQRITVPASGGTLSFLTWGNLQPVKTTISAVTSAGTTTLLAYTPPPLQATVATCTKAKPVTKSIDMSAFEGRTVTLRIESTSTGSDGTIADFDDFRLSAGGGSSTPSAPAPVLAEREAASTVSGTVLVRARGGTTFEPLTSATLVGVGVTIDATHGRVKLTAATPHGTVTGEFFDGEFTVTQTGSGLTVLTLTGGPVCAASAARARHAPVHRQKLWGDAHGGFQTSGTYASATDIGTQWLTKDTCTGTAVRVTSGKVRVHDRVTGQTFFLLAPRTYIAHP